MRIGTTKFNPGVILAIALLIAAAAPAQHLVITSGGRRVIDREPGSAQMNCLGWTYGPAPALGDHGELVGMYVASDALTQHCRPGIGLDSELRFGDAIRFHAFEQEGTWSDGVNVVDRTRLPWMNDVVFLNANLQTFAGHVASPSVVRRDGRWYMAFAASLDDRNLCAGEHYAGNPCGSCFDPWSYFVIGWAVSDDGIAWRIRERALGDPTFLGRPPTTAETLPGSNFKGLTRVSLVAYGDSFYIAAQEWGIDSLQIGMFRVPDDPSNEWGLGGDAEIVPTSLTGFLGSIARTRDGFLALSAQSNLIAYQRSQNLIDWTPPQLMRSSIPFLADGFGYPISVIDPVAVEDADGTLHLFFASADGDADHGIPRDGRHDCGIYSDFGPTAAYVGTGIYEAIVERRDVLRPTRTWITALRSGRYEVRVTASDRTVPQGNVVVQDAGGAFRIVPLVKGVAVVDLPLLTQAWFDAQGEWDASRAAVIRWVAQPARGPSARITTR